MCRTKKTRWSSDNARPRLQIRKRTKQQHILGETGDSLHVGQTTHQSHMLKSQPPPTSVFCVQDWWIQTGSASAPPRTPYASCHVLSPFSVRGWQWAEASQYIQYCPYTWCLYCTGFMSSSFPGSVLYLAPLKIYLILLHCICSNECDLSAPHPPREM